MVVGVRLLTEQLRDRDGIPRTGRAPVILHLLSDNVIHSLWIPQFNGKTELMITGHERTMWFTPTQTAFSSANARSTAVSNTHG